MFYQAPHGGSLIQCPRIISQMDERELEQAKRNAAENARVVLDLQAELARVETDYTREKGRLHEEVNEAMLLNFEARANLQQPFLSHDVDSSKQA